MQIYNDTHLFLHIPKCGGTAVAAWLNENIPSMEPGGFPIGHVPASCVEDCIGRPISSFDRVWAIVRNPYAQQLSQWAFWRYRWTQHNQRHWCDQIAMQSTLEQFVECPESSGRFLGGHEYDYHAIAGIRPEDVGGIYRWWLQVDGEIPGNVRVFRLENLQPLWDEVESLIGHEPSPIVSYSECGRGAWRPYYTPRAIEAVNRKFDWSFATHYDRYNPAPSAVPGPRRVEPERHEVPA